ncbi:hypothetical protein AVEN_28025-1 [Araneus ventricosus]|uniref:Uncharacterized protein n=1 Tax=Araneus ventricosus TaxID=182803 RepID=A0A4Y2BFV8_ARAVE|nr:hypothetical protein AVEN_28025-1 [Araneus ventricosus]
MLSIIDLVREDTFRTVMLKIEDVKYIFVWFSTPKIVTRHNAEEKEKEGRNIRFSRGFAVECPPECMVPTRRRPSAQGIKCPTVHSGHIPVTSHWVWWLRRMASTLT